MGWSVSIIPYKIKAGVAVDIPVTLAQAGLYVKIKSESYCSRGISSRIAITEMGETVLLIVHKPYREEDSLLRICVRDGALYRLFCGNGSCKLAMRLEAILRGLYGTDLIAEVDWMTKEKGS